MSIRSGDPYPIQPSAIFRWTDTPLSPPAPIFAQQPRTLPVNIPFSDIGITIVTMDADGNVTIKVNQPASEQGT